MSLYETRLCGDTDHSCIYPKINVISYDLNAKKIELYKTSIKPKNEFRTEAISKCE